MDLPWQTSETGQSAGVWFPFAHRLERNVTVLYSDFVFWMLGKTLAAFGRGRESVPSHLQHVTPHVMSWRKALLVLASLVIYLALGRSDQNHFPQLFVSVLTAGLIHCDAWAANARTGISRWMPCSDVLYAGLGPAKMRTECEAEILLPD